MRKSGNEIMAEYQARITAEKLAQHVTASCALCDWTASGTLAETRDAHAAHRAIEHPEMQPKRRAKRPTLSIPMNGKGLDENINQARAQGAATWDGAAA